MAGTHEEGQTGDEIPQDDTGTKEGVGKDEQEVEVPSAGDGDPSLPADECQEAPPKDGAEYASDTANDGADDEEKGLPLRPAVTIDPEAPPEDAAGEDVTSDAEPTSPTSPKSRRSRMGRSSLTVNTAKSPDGSLEPMSPSRKASTRSQGRGSASPASPLSPSRRRQSTESIGSSLANQQRTDWEAEMTKLFNEFDTDKSGTIDADELREAWRRAGGEDISDDELLKMLEAMDEDHSGTVDLGEWMRFMEKHGMGADSAAFSRGGAAGFKMDLKTALTFIQSETNQAPDLSKEEHEEIELIAAAHCPKDHQLHRVLQEKLSEEPFFFGCGGFTCSKCTVHSSNLVSKEAWLCSPCHYVLCVLCAHVTKKEAVQREVTHRLAQKRSRFTRKETHTNMHGHGKTVNRGRKTSLQGGSLVARRSLSGEDSGAAGRGSRRGSKIPQAVEEEVPGAPISP